jgi:hypothetical protein
MYIRYQLLAKLVKMWKNDELLEKIDGLPIELHPRKQKPKGRCCVYKERAVTKYKTMAMMGFDMEDEKDENEPLQLCPEDARPQRPAPEQEHPERDGRGLLFLREDQLRG